MDTAKKKLRRYDAKKFIQQIKVYLEQEHHLQPQREYPLGVERWCSKSDIYVEFNGGKLFIEVEGSQPHPDTNVTKYWYWIEHTKNKGKIILIHVFGNEFYDNNYRSRTALCGFIAEKIKKQSIDFVYYPIPIKKHHSWSENWSISNLLELTKRRINVLLKNH